MPSTICGAAHCRMLGDAIVVTDADSDLQVSVAEQVQVLLGALLQIIHQAFEYECLDPFDAKYID